MVYLVSIIINTRSNIKSILYVWKSIVKDYYSYYS